VAQALERAQVAWLGLRPHADTDHIDNVLSLEGDFSKLRPDQDAQWSQRDLLGGPWQLYERTAEATRTAPMRLYARGEKLWVFSSVAEIDAVERLLEHGPDARALRPASQGAVSAAARAPALAELIASRSPKAARLLRGAKTLSLHFDWTHVGLDGRLELEFLDAERAERATRAMQLLVVALSAQGATGEQIGSGLRLAQVKQTLSVALSYDNATLGEISRCAGSSDQCAW
jgi:hypothetical protein